MKTMELYNSMRVVPPEAQKKISGGRLSGMTDINPMWRIKQLTETFGPCGIGWWYVIKKEWLEHGPNEEISAFVDIDLFYKWNGETSQPIPGTGGSSFVASEKSGLYMSDECFKMALTDALGIAGKALGLGADVWFARDTTKYTQPELPPGERPAEPTSTGAISEKQEKRLFAIANAAGIDAGAVLKVLVHDYKKTSVASLSKTEYEEVCTRLQAPKQPAPNGG